MIRVGLDRIKLIHSDLTIRHSLEMGRFKNECPVLTSAVQTTPFLSGNVSLTLPRHYLSLGQYVTNEQNNIVLFNVSLGLKPLLSLL